MKKPAIFVDRDGTLIEEVNYLSRVEDLLLYDFTPRAVRELKRFGFLVIVVTNQSGIGRSIFAESDMHEIHSEIQSQLNGDIDAFYFCPHLPDWGRACRKPGTGMIESAMKEFDIDLARSWVIGDKQLDVELGQRAGLDTALVLTGYGAEHKKQFEVRPTIVTADFGAAVKEILERFGNAG